MEELCESTGFGMMALPKEKEKEVHVVCIYVLIMKPSRSRIAYIKCR